MIGQKVFLAGGVNGTDFKVVTWLWEYDAAADKLDEAQRRCAPGMLRGLTWPVFAASGKGYSRVRGQRGRQQRAQGHPERSATYQYDPTTDTWTRQADFPGVPRGANFTNKEYNGIALTFNGRPFVGWGTWVGFRQPGNQYKPASYAWRNGPTVPPALAFTSLPWAIDGSIPLRRAANRTGTTTQRPSLDPADRFLFPRQQPNDWDVAGRRLATARAYFRLRPGHRVADREVCPDVVGY